MKYRPICQTCFRCMCRRAHGWSDFVMFVDAIHINFTLERNSFRLSGIIFMQTATISSKNVWFRCANILPSWKYFARYKANVIYFKIYLRTKARRVRCSDVCDVFVHLWVFLSWNHLSRRPCWYCVGGRYNRTFLKEFTWKSGFVLRGGKCFCS